MNLPSGRLTAEELALGRQIRAGIPGLMQSPTPTQVVLLDTRLLLVNDAMARLSGYARDELLGVEGALLLRPDLRAGARSHSAAVERGEPVDSQTGPDTFHRRVTLITRSGDPMDVRADAVLLRDKDGRPVAALVIVLPVAGPQPRSHPWTRRLGAVDAALVAEALEDLPTFDVLAEPTTVTAPSGILLQLNAAFTTEFGWENPEVVGLPAADLLVPELRGWAEERLIEVTGAPLVPRPATSRLRHRDGRAVPVETSSLPVRDPEGRARYIVSTIIPSANATPAP